VEPEDLEMDPDLALADEALVAVMVELSARAKALAPYFSNHHQRALQAFGRSAMAIAADALKTSAAVRAAARGARKRKS
jgi:hypothetical protein